MSNPKNNSHYIDGRSLKTYFCIVCGNKIHKDTFLYRNKKCKSCIMKKKFNGNYKDGRTLKDYFCIDCNKKVWMNSKYCKKCMGLNQCGKNNYNWKGGITSLWQLIRELYESKDWRKEVFQRDNYTCQECGDNQGGNLEAHHKKRFSIILQEFLNYYSQFSIIEDKETLVRLAITWKDFWDLDNGQTLCNDCHKLINK